MKVLCNVLYAKVGGGLTYAVNQVASLADQPDMEVRLLVSPWNADAFRAIPAIPRTAVHEVRVPNVPARFAWEQSVLPLRAARSACDVLLSSGNFAPLLSKVPSVMVLQNPNFVGAGRVRSAGRGLGYRSKVRLSFESMRRADTLVSVSNVLAEEIRSEPRLRGIDLVTVRTAGPVAVTDAVDGREVEDLVGPEPFLLSVANDYPHKRLDDLGELVRRLADASTGLPRRVVLAGDIPSTRRADIERRAGDHSAMLHFLGPVADRRVVAGLYDKAFAAVSTSEMESWGLTLPEAGARGCPVVATDLPAHREVAGDRAHYFEPGDVAGLIDRLRDVASTSRPTPWGLDRTWQDHGRELAEVLRRAVQRHEG